MAFHTDCFDIASPPLPQTRPTTSLADGQGAHSTLVSKRFGNELLGFVYDQILNCKSYNLSSLCVSVGPYLHGAVPRGVLPLFGPKHFLSSRKGLRAQPQLLRRCTHPPDDAEYVILSPERRHLSLTFCRLTRLRYSVLGNILPVDSATKFHQVNAWPILKHPKPQILQIIGILTVVFSLAHTMLHLLNFINYGELAWWCYFVTAPKGYGVAGTQGITGVILLTILLTIAAASLPCMVPMTPFVTLFLTQCQGVRRSGHFEVFYYTHKLIWPWVVALLIHSKVFWKWAIVPLILYCSEVAYRLLIARKKALLLAAEPLPDKVERVHDDDVDVDVGYRW